MLDLRDVPIELETPADGSPPDTDDGPSRGGAITALVAATGLVITLVLLNGLEPDGRRYQSGVTRLDLDAAPDAALDGEGQAAPAAGVDATDDLVDSQTLTVTGSGFAPGVGITLTQCVLGLVEPVSNCYQSSAQDRVEADEYGEFSIRTIARRLLQSDSGVLDCAHLTAGRCAMVVTADHSASPRTTRYGGAVQLRYDRAPARPDSGRPAAPPLDAGPARPPDFEISLETDTGLGDGERVTVLVDDAEPRTRLTFELCAPATPATADCPPVAEGELGDLGRAWFDIRLPRLTRDSESAAVVDCVEGCDLRVRSEMSQVDIPVRFDPAGDLLPPAVLTLADEATVPGQSVTVTGSGFLPLTTLDAFICNRPIQRDEEYWSDPVHWCGWPPAGLWATDPVLSDDGAFEATLVHPHSIDLFSWTGPHQCHLQDCWLVVTTGETPGTTPVGSVRISGDE